MRALRIRHGVRVDRMLHFRLSVRASWDFTLGPAELGFKLCACQSMINETVL